MRDPRLSQEDDLRVKRALSRAAHAFCDFAEATGRACLPVEFLHCRYEGGAIFTWNEGQTSISVAGKGRKLTLDELDAEIAAASSMRSTTS